MDVTQFDGTVYKRATIPSECRRLAREAHVLRTVAHPGVVRVLRSEGGDPPSALVLEAVAGGALARVGTTMSPGAVARLGAVLAETVADLHAIGWVHGSLRPEHVLLDADSRPVLCGLGSAVQAGEVGDWDRRQRDELSDLARLLSSLLARDRESDLRRVLERPRSCRRLAEELRTYDPGGRASRQKTRPSFVAWSVSLVGLALGLWLGLGPIVRLAGRPSTESVSCPVVDRGCTAVAGPVRANVRLITAAASVVVIGRWGCGPLALPAVLNPATGAVWMFSGWPRPGHPVEARLLVQIAGASWLRVQPARSGCDQIVVGRRAQPPVLLPAGQRG